jgi:hypothetical protein
MMALLQFGPKAKGTVPRLRDLEKDPDRQVREVATFVREKIEN